MHIHRKNTVNEPLGKMTDATYSSLSFLHFMNSKPAAFDRSSLDGPDRGHKPTIIRLRIMCAVLALRIRPSCSFITNTIITDSCLTAALTNSFSM